jgi:hypothetical protein
MAVIPGRRAQGLIPSPSLSPSQRLFRERGTFALIPSADELSRFPLYGPELGARKKVPMRDTVVWFRSMPVRQISSRVADVIALILHFDCKSAAPKN